MQKNTVWSEKKLEPEYLPRINNSKELNDSTQIEKVNTQVGKEVSINGWV